MELFKCKSFNLRELVSKIVYDYYVPKYGENFLWLMFPEQALRELDTIRMEWGKYCNNVPELKGTSRSIFINTWWFDGAMTQRGFRSNIDPMVKAKRTPYLSAHCFFKAFDLEPQNKAYQQFYDFVWGLMQSGKLKFFKRLESGKVTVPKGYIHIDGMETASGKPEVFKP